MTEKRNFRFADQLLYYISSGRNDEAKSMLSKDLCSVADVYGTLLHHAANLENDVIIRYLVELGSDVNSQESDSAQTPIMIAVDINSGIAIKALLEAGADIDITNDDGKSALQLAFVVNNFDLEVVQAFFDRLRSENLSTEDFVERLINAGCPLYHAVYLRDMKVLEEMIKHGIDVNSEGYDDKTALFAAVELDDVQMAEMFIVNGADVNVIDEEDESVLFLAATNGNSEIVRLLMQECAYPDAEDPDTGHTPLFQIFANATVETQDKYYKCAVILLRNDADFRQSSVVNPLTLFELAANNQCYELIKLLVAHIALVKTMYDRSLTQPSDYCEDVVEKWTKSYENYYKNCMRILKISLIGKLTLLDFFGYEDEKMRRCMRDERLNNEIMNVYKEEKLSEDYLYYFEIISERVKRANQMVKREKIAISILTIIFNKCFGHSKGECFVVAEKVVGYLTDYWITELFRVNRTMNVDT